MSEWWGRLLWLECWGGGLGLLECWGRLGWLEEERLRLSSMLPDPVVCDDTVKCIACTGVGADLGVDLHGQS